MSTYSTSEAALLTRIRAMDGGGSYDTGNSSRGDYRVFDAPGRQLACVVVRAGRSLMGDRMENGRGSHGKRQQRHRIAAIVAQKRGQLSDEAAYTALMDAIDALIAWVDTYPRLGNVTDVKRAEAVEVSEPRRNQTSTHIYASILFDVYTETEPVLTESAR